MVESGRGGTHQARFERDVIHEQVAARVNQLDIGDSSLVFGRIDQTDDRGGESFYIGRVAVWDDQQEPITVDWRAPIAESFYRATGREPMGLARRATSRPEAEHCSASRTSSSATALARISTGRCSKAR